MDGIAWEKQAINSPLPANLYTSRRCWSSGEQNMLVKHTTLIFPHFFAPATVRRHTFSPGAGAEPVCAKYHLQRFDRCSPHQQLKFGFTSAKYWMGMSLCSKVKHIDLSDMPQAQTVKILLCCKGMHAFISSLPPLGFRGDGGGGEGCCISPAADLWCF